MSEALFYLLHVFRLFAKACNTMISNHQKKSGITGSLFSLSFGFFLGPLYCLSVCLSLHTLSWTEKKKQNPDRHPWLTFFFLFRCFCCLRVCPPLVSFQGRGGGESVCVCVYVGDFLRWFGLADWAGGAPHKIGEMDLLQYYFLLTAVNLRVNASQAARLTFFCLVFHSENQR